MENAVTSSFPDPRDPDYDCYRNIEFNAAQRREATGNWRPVASNVELRPVSDIDEKYRHVFSAFQFFNVIQSLAFDALMKSDDSVVVTAPTGSGKTVIFELAMIRLLENYGSCVGNNFKIVYVAPIKALCSERFADWKQKFSKIGLNCLELTGDSQEDIFSIDTYHLILTTPEKWDSITRKWKENNFPVEKVKLFMIDEVHLLNEEKRGPTLEAVVCRMKLAQCLNAHSVNIRFIAVSATIPNVEDITEWLSSKNVKAHHFQMSEESRPVKLKKVVIGYPVKNNQSPFMFDLSLNYRLKNIIPKYSDGKPTLIFCSTRKGVLQAASTLAKELSLEPSPDQRRLIDETTEKIHDGKLKELLNSGIGCHHAGIDYEDRRLIEELFRSGCLPVLMATSTLAMGINLPAHLVIIKSTEFYVDGGYREYSESQVLQMIGRAGRPQFDLEATAVIMTKESLKKRYENVIEGIQPVESNLHRHLTEHLNSEVVLRTIPDIALAMDWIRSTFLYIRTQKNPAHYKLPRNLTNAQMENKLQGWCMRELNGLVRYELALLTDGYDVSPTPQGSIMAQFCISFETMKLFTQVKGTENLEEFLQIFVGAEEFKDMVLRMSERSALNSLNKKQALIKLRFPLKGKIKNAAMKVNCLIQAHFGCLPLFDSALKQDVTKIVRVGKRLAQGLVQLLWLKQDDTYQGLLSAILLAKCFNANLWENSINVSRQLPGIGPVLSQLLVSAKKETFADLLNSNPRDIEMLLNRNPPFGNTLIDNVKILPQFDLELRLSESKETIFTEVKIMNTADVLKSKKLYEVYYFLIGNSDSNQVLHKSKFSLDSLLKRGGFYCLSLPLEDGNRAQSTSAIAAHVISKSWVGLDISKSLSDTDHRGDLSNRVAPEKLTRQCKPTTSEESNWSKYKKGKVPKASTKKAASRTKKATSSTKEAALSKQSESLKPQSEGTKTKLFLDQKQTKLSDFAFTPRRLLEKPTFAEGMKSIDAVARLNDMEDSEFNKLFGSNFCEVSSSNLPIDKHQPPSENLTASSNSKASISKINGSGKNLKSFSFRDHQAHSQHHNSDIPDRTTNDNGYLFKNSPVVNNSKVVESPEDYSKMIFGRGYGLFPNSKYEISDIIDAEFQRRFPHYLDLASPNSSASNENHEASLKNANVVDSLEQIEPNPNALHLSTKSFPIHKSKVPSHINDSSMVKSQEDVRLNDNYCKNSGSETFASSQVIGNDRRNVEFSSSLQSVPKRSVGDLRIDSRNIAQCDSTREIQNGESTNVNFSDSDRKARGCIVDDEEFEEFLRGLNEDAGRSTPTSSAQFASSKCQNQFSVDTEDNTSSSPVRKFPFASVTQSESIPKMEQCTGDAESALSIINASDSKLFLKSISSAQQNDFPPQYREHSPVSRNRTLNPHSGINNVELTNRFSPTQLSALVTKENLFSSQPGQFRSQDQSKCTNNIQKISNGDNYFPRRTSENPSNNFRLMSCRSMSMYEGKVRSQSFPRNKQGYGSQNILDEDSHFPRYSTENSVSNSHLTSHQGAFVDENNKSHFVNIHSSAKVPLHSLDKQRCSSQTFEQNYFVDDGRNLSSRYKHYPCSTIEDPNNYPCSITANQSNNTHSMSQKNMPRVDFNRHRSFSNSLHSTHIPQYSVHKQGAGSQPNEPDCFENQWNLRENCSTYPSIENPAKNFHRMPQSSTQTNEGDRSGHLSNAHSNEEFWPSPSKKQRISCQSNQQNPCQSAWPSMPVMKANGQNNLTVTPLDTHEHLFPFDESTISSLAKDQNIFIKRQQGLHQRGKNGDNRFDNLFTDSRPEPSVLRESVTGPFFEEQSICFKPHRNAPVGCETRDGYFSRATPFTSDSSASGLQSVEQNPMERLAVVPFVEKQFVPFAAEKTNFNETWSSQQKLPFRENDELNPRVLKAFDNYASSHVADGRLNFSSSNGRRSNLFFNSEINPSLGNEGFYKPVDEKLLINRQLENISQKSSRTSNETRNPFLQGLENFIPLTQRSDSSCLSQESQMGRVRSQILSKSGSKENKPVTLPYSNSSGQDNVQESDNREKGPELTIRKAKGTKPIDDAQRYRSYDRNDIASLKPSENSKNVKTDVKSVLNLVNGSSEYPASSRESKSLSTAPSSNPCTVLSLIQEKIGELCQPTMFDSNGTNAGVQTSKPSSKFKFRQGCSSKILSSETQTKGASCSDGKLESARPYLQSPEENKSEVDSPPNHAFKNVNPCTSFSSNSLSSVRSKNNQIVSVSRVTRLGDQFANISNQSSETTCSSKDELSSVNSVIKPPRLKLFSLKTDMKSEDKSESKLSPFKSWKTLNSCEKYKSRSSKDKKQSGSLFTPLKNYQNDSSKIGCRKNSASLKEKHRMKAFVKSLKNHNNPAETCSPDSEPSGDLRIEILAPMGKPKHPTIDSCQPRDDEDDEHFDDPVEDTEEKFDVNSSNSNNLVYPSSVTCERPFPNSEPRKTTNDSYRRSDFVNSFHSSSPAPSSQNLLFPHSDSRKITNPVGNYDCNSFINKDLRSRCIDTNEWTNLHPSASSRLPMSDRHSWRNYPSMPESSLWNEGCNFFQSNRSHSSFLNSNPNLYNYYSNNNHSNNPENSFPHGFRSAHPFGFSNYLNPQPGGSFNSFEGTNCDLRNTNYDFNPDVNLSSRFDSNFYNMGDSMRNVNFSQGASYPEPSGAHSFQPAYPNTLPSTQFYRRPEFPVSETAFFNSRSFHCDGSTQASHSNLNSEPMPPYYGSSRFM